MIRNMSDMQGILQETAFAGLPLIIQEFNLSFVQRNAFNDMEAKAAIMVRHMVQSIGEVKMAAYWPMSDLYAGDYDASRLLNGACGLISANGICKPVLYALQFVRELQDIVVARDPRWGRVSEGSGEDPYLGSVFARAKIRGIQNEKSSTENYLAACKEEVIGAWVMGWQKEDCVSILDGMKNVNANVKYYPCGGPEGVLNEKEIEAAVQGGDVIVAVVGELVNMTGEASSKANIELPGEQRKMLELLLKSGKPVVTVLMNGRPLALGWEAENLPVIVEAWHLGIQMGNAVADMLYGKVNPSGKLAASFPAVNGQCPIYYNHTSTGRPASGSKFTSKYMDAPWEAVFPCGYGLSYSAFEYSDLELKETDTTVKVKVQLKNTGKVKGTEVVQFYVQDVTAKLVRPVKELKAFRRVTLETGEAQCVEAEISKAELGYYDNDARYVRENGLFRFYVGGNSRDNMCEELRILFSDKQ